ncbi:uncharacterized protein AB675_5640 [Cyphellophora attinorum]|uniref:Uncharacterized protein n=1 Tax=Cyphellophora attinorum TaxID=1664694 RepID=A0A0N0NNR3_9EURO|nr:uncharacterized protein AB675_5640 [Phialophora attinorum]KPI41848.1 hypothetical protein AB675_5640 [Phialophora attinorum]
MARPTPSAPLHATQQRPILLLGAGELGLALLHHLTTHPSFSPTLHPVTLALRPSTFTDPNRAADLASYRAIHPAVSFLGLDIADAATTVEVLAAKFGEGGYGTIIHANGMTLPPGSQRKLTEAVLLYAAAEEGDSGKKRGVRYLPWQFGVDYDILGPRNAGDGLFSEAYGVRELLRSPQNQGTVEWLVVSCGIFTSFLFEEIWGVVTTTPEKQIRVRALGSWEDGITATTAGDIARVTAELVLEPHGYVKEWRENKVYIAGETLTYAQLVDTVQRVTAREVLRDQVWDRATTAREVQNASADQKKIWQYRAVFGGGEGVSWPVEETWNQKRGWVMEGIEGWLTKNLGKFSMK